MEGLSRFSELAAKKYDPATDGRVHGGEGWREIRCSVCEDEGNVYHAAQRPKDGRWYLFLARCSCSSPGALSEKAVHKVKGRADRLVAEVPRYQDAHRTERGGGVKREDTIPMRLSVFFDLAAGRLDMEISDEPRLVKYRREIVRRVQRRRTNPATGESEIYDEELRW